MGCLFIGLVIAAKAIHLRSGRREARHVPWSFVHLYFLLYIYVGPHTRAGLGGWYWPRASRKAGGGGRCGHRSADGQGVRFTGAHKPCVRASIKGFFYVKLTPKMVTKMEQCAVFRYQQYVCVSMADKLGFPFKKLPSQYVNKTLYCALQITTQQQQQVLLRLDILVVSNFVG